MKFKTSGTTGKPKVLNVDDEIINRGIVKSNKHLYDIWGLTYGDNTVAKYLVLKQAFVNGNVVIPLMNMSRFEIIENINNHKITHLSATPTWYRMLEPFDFVCKSTKKLVFSGELFDVMLADRAKKSFPNAEILNIYSSTETGQVLISKNEFFPITDDVRIKDDTLFIKVSDKWHYTGDIVKSYGNVFKIVGRQDSIVNVGGIKVIPEKVEESIKILPFVKNAIVYGRSSDVTGQVLVSDIILFRRDKWNKKYYTDVIKKMLLNKFKRKEFVPVIINYVDEIKYTNTGKVKR